MFENLRQAYPFQNRVKHNLKTMGLVTMASMLILLYFQPFGINFLKTPQTAYFVLIAGCLTAFILFGNSVVLPGILPRIFNPRRWTVGKELVYNIWNLMCLTAVYVLLAHVFQSVQLAVIPIWGAGALAVLPIVLLNLLNYNAQLKGKMVKALGDGRSFLDEKLNEIQHGHVIRFSSENGRDVLEIDQKQLLVVRSASNYIEIFWRDEEKIKKYLLRSTFSDAEKLLVNYPQFMKSHRCFLVNIKQIKRIVRNSSHTRLQFAGLDFDVPVARSFIPDFRRIHV